MKKLVCAGLFALMPFMVNAEDVTPPVDVPVDITPIAVTTSIKPDANTKVIEDFYALITKTDDPADDDADLKQRASLVVAKNWVNIPGGPEKQGLDGFVGTFTRYHQAIPNIKWTVDAIYKSGQNYIVRSTGSGTPVADFLGLGSAWITGNSFSMIAIDIHTIKKGKVIKSYHVEDWRTAMKQLSTPVTPPTDTTTGGSTGEVTTGQ